jgi:PAS domain S-box-containing protein
MNTRKTKLELLQELEASRKRIAELESDQKQADKDGKPVYMMGVLQDTADRKQAETELKRQKELLQNIVDNIPVMIALIDPAGRTQWVNRSWERTLGWTLEEATSRDILLDMYPDPEERQQVLDFAESGGGRWGDFHSCTKAGHFIETSWANVTLSDGSSIGIGQDITWRKQGEERLRASEAKFKAVFDNAPVGISLLDAQRNLLEANDTLGQMIGMDKRRLADGGYRKRKYIREDGSEIPTTELASTRAIVERRAVRNVVNGIVVEDGEIIWTQVSAAPLGLDDPRFVVITQDITNRKKAEEKLRESELRFSRIFEHSPVAIGISRIRDDELTEVNAAMCALSGYSRQELLGHTVVELGIWVDLQDRQSLIERLHLESRVINLETSLRHKSGRLVDILMSAEIIDIYNETSLVIQLVDITERKQAESSLLESEEKFRKAFLTSPDSININRLEDGIYVSINPGFTQILGYTEEEVLGRSSLGLQIWENLEDRQRLVEGLRKDGFVSNLEARFLGKEGRVKWGLMSASMIELNGVPHILSVTRDITKRKQAEEKVRALQQFSAATLDALSAHLCVLDENGFIISVNQAWREFADTNPPCPAGHFIGTNYLAVCDDARGKDAEGASEVAQGIRAVMSGSLDDFHLEYPCHSPEENRWFVAKVTRFFQNDLVRIALAHESITERKQAEEKLRESERKYRDLLNEMKDSVWVSDLEMNFMDANDTALRVTGYTRDEILAMKISDLATRTDPEQFSALLEKLSKDTAVMFEALHRAKDGREIPVEVNVSLMTFEGKPAMMGIARDISERKQTEERLRESEEKYRGLIESLDSVIALVDGDGRFGYMNEVAARQLGGTVQDFIGRSISELFPPEVAALQLSGIHKIFREGRSHTSENLSFIQGQPRWYRNNLQPIHDEHGTITQVLVNATDIHDLKTLQQELQELNETLEARVKERTAQIQDLYDNAPSGYQSVDQNGNIISINQTGLRWLGYTKDELLGRHITTIFPVAIVEANLPVLIRDGVIRDLEFKITRKDGSRFPVLLNAVAVYDQDGQFIRSRGTLIDITERKRAEDALKDAIQELERALRVKDEFLANMSHELRTPLNAIIGLSDSMLEGFTGDLNPKQQKYISTVLDSGQHLLSLINDILDLAKIGAGQVTLEPNLVAVNSVCQSSLLMIKQLALKKSLAVHIDIDEQIDFITADERRLKQMIVNLLTNAVKFTPAKGQVGLEVRGDRTNQWTRFTVWDTGIGISKEDQARLFQPFVQVNSSLVRDAGGTGLGLALVAQMARLHGGHVSLESEPGKGSRFSFTLPWTDQPMSASRITGTTGRSTPTTTRTTSSKKQTILLIEDTEMVIMTVRDYLEFDGYRVEVARDGQEGIALANQIHPDLILMDIQMPVMDGLEATRRLRAQTEFQDTPIIALTAFAMTGDRERCLEAGATEYLSKPVHLKGLVEMIQKYFEAENGFGA